MKGWQRAAFVAALIGAAGLGSAALAQPVRGQVRIKQPAKTIELFGGSRIGVSIRDLEEADAKATKGATAGVVIEDVSDGSPAEKAGMRKSDVIVEFDGERVRSVRQLTRLVQETPSGRSVTVSISRDGQRSSLTVTPEDSARFSFDRFDSDVFARLAPRPPAPPSPPSPPAIWKFDELFSRSSRLGITVDALSPQLAEYFGTKQGALVSSVTDNSAAAKAGIKAGDVITSFNGSTVDEPADVRRRMQDLREGDDFTIGVMRDRKPLTLKGQVERTQRRYTSRSII